MSVTFGFQHVADATPECRSCVMLSLQTSDAVGVQRGKGVSMTVGDSVVAQLAPNEFVAGDVVAMTGDEVEIMPFRDHMKRSWVTIGKCKTYPKSMLLELGLV